jgi:hypothetical protein
MYFTQTVRVFWPKNPDVAMQIAKPSAEWRLGQGHQKEGPGLSQLTKAGNDWRDVLGQPLEPLILFAFACSVMAKIKRRVAKGRETGVAMADGSARSGSDCNLVSGGSGHSAHCGVVRDNRSRAWASCLMNAPDSPPWTLSVVEHT